MEQVQSIRISDLHSFDGQLFKVLDDDAMAQTVESIRDYGITTPLLVRPDPDRGYEIISGHRRHHAAELFGMETVICIVREMDDDAAITTMVGSNLLRENILPSERAFAYKMKMDVIKHQGRNTDLTSCQVGTKSRLDESLAFPHEGAWGKRYPPGGSRFSGFAIFAGVRYVPINDQPVYGRASHPCNIQAIIMNDRSSGMQFVRDVGDQSALFHDLKNMFRDWVAGVCFPGRFIADHAQSVIYI